MTHEGVASRTGIVGAGSAGVSKIAPSESEEIETIVSHFKCQPDRNQEESDPEREPRNLCDKSLERVEQTTEGEGVARG